MDVANNTLVLQVIFGLLLIIGLIFLLAWLAKRLPMNTTGSDIFEVIAQFYVAPKQRLMVVSLGGESWLLSATPDSIQKIDKLSDQVVQKLKTSKTPKADFKALMQRALTRQPGEKAHD